MSSSDKTKNKLMETMRMTKSDPGKKVEAAEKKQTKAPQAEKPTKKKENKVAAKNVAKDTQNLTVDPYQTTRRRLWPD